MGKINKIYLDGRPITKEELEFVRKQTLANDTVFKAILSQEDVMRTVIRAFLGIDVQSLEYISTEEYKKADQLKSSAVKLDVICRTADGRTINVEVQRGNRPDLVRRARYYSSVLDVFFADTRKGTDYNIPDSFVLFFCSDASFPFDGVVADGTFQYAVLGGVPSSIPDGRHILFVNYDRFGELGDYYVGEASDFCATLSGNNLAQTTAFASELEERILAFKESELGMSNILKDEYEREHQEELLRQAEERGSREAIWQSTLSMVQSFRDKGQPLQFSRDFFAEYCKNIPSDIVEQALRQVYGSTYR